MAESVPNQRIITLEKKEVANKMNPYAVINVKALQLAMNGLTPSAFKLWCYFDKNQEGFTMAVGPASVVDWGIKRSTFKNAMKELIDAGYLVENSPNHYSFFEIPKEDICTVVIEKKEDSDFIF